MAQHTKEIQQQKKQRIKLTIKDKKKLLSARKLHKKT